MIVWLDNIFALLLSYLLINYMYVTFLVHGLYKIYCGEYSIRRIKYCINSKDIEELKTIAIDSVGLIPNNPIFSGKNLDNKIVLIIYHKNKPVGFNIMFDYEYENEKCLHLGLVLINKNYQDKKLQVFSKYNIIPYMFENICRDIYITDIGRSALGLKLFNQGIKNSYPNLINNTLPTQFYKKLFKYFVNTFKEDTQIAINAIGDDDSFIVYKSNNNNGGANYLVEFNKSTVSKDEKYNKYINDNLDIEDEVISIGKVNMLTLLF